MKYNMLVVTDHTTHADTNSVYALCQALRAEERCDQIWVCSRGDLRNEGFFMAVPDAPIYAAPVLPHFAFHPEGIYFDEHAILMSREDIDVILVRMPQPLHPIFLNSLTAIVAPHRVINRPEGSMETSSKGFLLQLPHLCPGPVMCHSQEEAIHMSQTCEIVLKPLYAYGGRGILRLSTQHFWQGDDRYSVNEMASRLDNSFFPMMAFRFLRNVTLGDKRTIVVNRTIIGSALRLPAPGSWMCNVAQGGHAVLAEADSDERRIEEELTPMLYDKGIIMYGFDTLVDDDGRRVLSEINTLSIGGLLPLQELSGKPVLAQTAALVFDYLDEVS